LVREAAITIERYDMMNMTVECVAALPELPIPTAAEVADQVSKDTTTPRAVGPGKAPLQGSSTAAYAKDLRLFVTWGGQIPSSVAQLQKYIRNLGGKTAPVTIYRRLQAIRHAHIAQGLPSPTHDPILRPILRALQLGYAPSKSPTKAGSIPARPREAKSAKPLTRALLLRMLDAMHRNSLDRRDRAMLLLGFMAAMKRAELVALDVSSLRFTADALVVQLEARQVAVPATGGELCAVTATKDWINHAALDIEQPPGPLFRRFDRGGDPTLDRLDSAWVSVVVKTRLKAVGIDPKPFSAQSLRRGRLLESAKGL
jgi:integrase